MRVLIKDVHAAHRQRKTIAEVTELQIRHTNRTEVLDVATLIVFRLAPVARP